MNRIDRLRHVLLVFMLFATASSASAANVYLAEGVADLESKNLSGYDYVRLLYRSAPDDGGGGLLFKNPTASWTTKNNGTRYIDAIGTKFERQYDSAVTGVNVTWFGATGDGTTDDLGALQAAVTFVGTTGGGRVFIPDGTYRMINNPVTGVSQYGLLICYSNITLEFESANARLVPNHVATQKAISIAADTTGNPSAWVENITIVNGSIDGGNNKLGGAASEYAHGIDMRHARNVRIDGVVIRNCRGDGIYVALAVRTWRSTTS